MSWISRKRQRQELDQQLHALALSTKANPLSQLYLSTVGGGPQAHNVDKRAHLRVYFANAWAFAAIRAIAEAVSAVPLRVQQREFEDGEEVWTSLDNHPLLRIIERPNDDEPISYLLNKMVVSLLGSGDAFLFAPKLERQLFMLQPSWVKVNTDKIGRRLGYEIKEKEVKSLVDTEEIVHFRLVNPSGEYYGSPPSQVISKTLVTKLHLENYVKNYFENNALMGTTLSTDQPLTPEQRAQMRLDVDRLHKGADRAFRLAILDSGVKVDTLAHRLKDLIPTEMTKSLREEVLAAYRVPPVVVTVLDGASYSNADIQIQLFYKNTVVPVLCCIESFFNLQYTYLHGDNLRVWFDRDEIPELQEDLNAKTERVIKQAGNRPIITQNEARGILGFEAIEGGDSITVAPAFGDFGLPSLGDIEEEDEDSKLLNVDENSLLRKAIDSNDPKMIAWTNHYIKVTRKERDFMSVLRKYWNEQLARVVGSLDVLDLGDDDKNMNVGALRSMLSRMRIQYRGADDDTPRVFDIAREEELLRAFTANFFAETITEAGQAAIGQVGGKIPFNVNNPKVRESLDLFWNRIKKVNDTTYEDIKLILQEAYDEGYGLDKVTRILKTKYKWMNRVRAKRIASTEMNGLVNSGHMLGYAEVGVKQKEWVSAFLSTSRQSHIDVSGTIRDMDEPFEVGGAIMMHPSDPSGPPEETINCHCVLQPVQEEV